MVLSFIAVNKSTKNTHFLLYGMPNLAIALNHSMLSTVLVGPQLSDLISDLKEITEPHELGIHLGIETYELETFEKNYPRDINRQKMEVLKIWKRNSSDCSWGVLANAVEKMRKYGNLVKKLRDRHKEALKTATKQVKHEVL